MSMKALFKNSTISNVFSLYALQIGSYLLPLLTVPYLLRTLGAQYYGLIAFVQAFVTYFQMLIDYGFNYSATRDISVHSDNKQEINSIFSAVLYSKIVLLLLTSLVFVLIVQCVPKFRSNELLMWLTFGSVLGNVFFPTWLFQGLERMKHISVISLLSRIVFVIPIFFLIHSDHDYITAALLNSMGSIVAGVTGYVYACKLFGVKLTIVTFKRVIVQLKEGFHMFVSNMSISLYTVTNVFLLGLISNYTIVGYYSGADKIVRTVTAMISPIIQAIYPHASKKATGARIETVRLSSVMMLVVWGITIPASIFLILFSPTIVHLLFGLAYAKTITVLRIMGVLPFIIGSNTVLATITIIPLRMDRKLSFILMSAGIINFLINIVLDQPLGPYGAATAVVLTELYILLFEYLYLVKNKINIIPSIIQLMHNDKLLIKKG